MVSFAVITILLAAIYRYMPDARIGWRDVLLGAEFSKSWAKIQGRKILPEPGAVKTAEAK